MTRRLNHYDNPEWQPYLLVALAGAALIMLGIWFLLQQVFVSVRQRKQNQDITGDPWDGRTLEWSISSPAPFYNFAHVPHVDELDQFWEDKQSGRAYKRPAKYEDIHMPKNTSAGVFIGAFGLVMCFALIWHIWWLSIVGFVGMIGSFIVRAYDRDVDYWVPAAEVERIENAHFDKMQKAA
jgi:cytochrome o ubiquinol oxidase subunit 1